MSPNLRPFKRERERGQSLVEFALILPVMLLIFMAIFDFGRMMFLYSQLSNGAREGARAGSLVGVGTYTESNPLYLNCPAIRNAVRQTFGLATLVPDSDITIVYDNGATIKTYPSNGQQMSCNSLTSRPATTDINKGDRVRVTVRHTFRFSTPLLSNMFQPINFQFTSARTILKGGSLVGTSGSAP